MTDVATVRRERILEAALGVFAQLGYRKATMADVAQAADLSRQGLYLQFPSKQELLTAAVEYELQRALGAVREALAAPGDTADRIMNALDEWLGKSAGENADDVHILGRDNAALLASTFDRARQRFIDELATTVEQDFGVGSGDALKAGRALHAVATGWKYLARDRDDFRARVREAAGLIVSGAASPAK